jgi:hypothetical protein
MLLVPLALVYFGYKLIQGIRAFEDGYTER